MVTILNYYQGCFSFPVADEMIQAACYCRDTDPDWEFGDMTEQTRNLILADLLMMLSRASMTFDRKTSSDAFSMTISGERIPLEDRHAMRNEANAIYAKYEPASVKPRSVINIYPKPKTVEP